MDYKRVLDSGSPHLLLDVRPQVEVDICRLPHALHIPFETFGTEGCGEPESLGKVIGKGSRGAGKGRLSPSM